MWINKYKQTAEISDNNSDKMKCTFFWITQTTLWDVLQKEYDMRTRKESAVRNTRMMRLKRWLSWVLIGSFILSLSSCSQPSNTSATVATSAEANQEEAVKEDIASNDNTSQVQVNKGKEEDEIIPEEVDEEEIELSDTQKNSVAMLNYLAFLSQDINAHKNSRMFMEEAYASLINNTNPETVNEITQSHLSSLLDIIERYRMIAVKRERLRYIYEQNKAKAMHSIIPNPIGLLSAVSSGDAKRLAASVIYMAVDSYTSYKSENAALESEYLQDGWELDDEESANLHDSRKRAFEYMIEIVREENIPGNLALSESAIESFVKMKNNTNNHQRIQFYESEQATYQAFGFYWLELANSYYEDGNYAKCLESIAKYEDIKTNIFRRDYYLAQAMPNAIAAAADVYANDNEKYVEEVGRYLEVLLNNTEKNEWALRYFAAQMYVDLYNRKKDNDYLEKSYAIALDNVNSLVDEQRRLNAVYLGDVQEIVPEDTATDEERKQIKEYNKELHRIRETELPPIYEPLVINCDLLFALAEKLNVPNDKKVRIEGILRPQGERLFLDAAVDEIYKFGDVTARTVSASFDRDTLVIPAELLSDGTKVRVEVTEAGATTDYDDWVISKVDRKSDDLEDFMVTLTSEQADGQTWSADSTLKVFIENEEMFNYNPTVLAFKVGYYGTGLAGTGLWRNIEFEQVENN